MPTLPKFVIKKDGHRARFNPEKLRRSLLQTFHHAHSEDVHRIGAVLTDLFHELATGNETIDVGAIRKQVVAILNRHKLHAVSDAYDLTFLHLKKCSVAKVVKRDGREADFHPYNIWSAVRKAFRDARVDSPGEAEAITREVVQRLETRFGKAGTPPETTEIRRITERALIEHNQPQAAKAYARHRYL